MQPAPPDQSFEMSNMSSKSYSVEFENDCMLCMLGKQVIPSDETQNRYNTKVSKRKMKNLHFKKEESNERDTRNQPSQSDKKIFPLSWRKLENSGRVANSTSATIQKCVSNSGEFLT